MKKIFCVMLIAVMSLAMAVTASAASKAEDISGLTFKTEYTNDFSDEATVSSDFKKDHGTNSVVDGWLRMGNGADWIVGGPSVTLLTYFPEYVTEFDIKGVFTYSCYGGFGFRVPQDGSTNTSGQLYGGGRNGVDGGNDLGWGISVDIFTMNNANKIAVNYNYGAMSESTGFLVDYPEGFDYTKSNKVTIRDFGDNATVLINDAEIFTIIFSDLADGFYATATSYDAAGNEIAKNENVKVAEKGAVTFYERLNEVYVDNIVIKTVDTSAPVTPTPPTGDMSMAVVFMAAAMLLSAVAVTKKVRV